MCAFHTALPAASCCNAALSVAYVIMKHIVGYVTMQLTKINKVNLMLLTGNLLVFSFNVLLYDSCMQK